MSALAPIRWACYPSIGCIGETDRHYVELAGGRGAWTMTIYPAKFKQGVAVRGGDALEVREYRTKPEALAERL